MIRVFVAEDEPLILHDISDLIPKLNKTFSVTRSCTNGRQVLQALNEEIPDVLITDIQMPLITGLELIERIVTEKLPIICVILTSYKEFDYAQKAVGLSVFRYLLKPVDEGELSAVLHEIEKETASIEYTNRRREYFSLQKSEGEYANKKLIYDIEKYILDHLHENINQQSLADNFKYTAAYISRVFKKHTGFSPTRYLIRARIDKMKVLLKQNPSLSVKTITSLIGIDDPLYVSKLFKKETGMSVSEYKNTCKI